MKSNKTMNIVQRVRQMLQSGITIRVNKKSIIVSSFIIISLFTFIVIAQPESTDDTGREEFAYYMDIFMDALSYTRDNYVDKDKVNYHNLFYGAIQGMIESLGDTHSAFLDEQRFSALQQGIEGEFGGIGIHIDEEDGYPIVIAPIEGTPAWQKGIKSKDRIIEVEGKPTKDRPLEEIIGELKGPIGTEVTFKIQRSNMDEPLTLSVRRERITIPTIKEAIIDNSIGYIRMIQFSKDTDHDLMESLQRLKSKGVSKIILDLRWNPGGLLTSAVEVCQHFISEGKIVFTRGRYLWENEDFYADPKKVIFDTAPMVVLINNASASASEIVAGAIQETHRGVIVGTRSYGKGSVQNVYPLRTSVRENIGMRMTVQKYYTPSGKSIHGEGINPDVVVDFPERTVEDNYLMYVLKKENYIQDLLNKHPEPTEAQIQSDIIDKLKEKHLPINEELIRIEIRYEQNRYNAERTIFDLDYDVQLKKALEVFSDSKWFKRDLVVYK